MIRVFIADPTLKERLALRLLCLVLDMQVIGEADDWHTTWTDAPRTNPNLIVMDWELLPNAHAEAVAELRRACPLALVIILISSRSIRQQADLSLSADMLISKHEPAEQVLESLRLAASTVAAKEPPPPLRLKYHRPA